MNSGRWPPNALYDFALALPFEHLLRKRAPQEAIARWKMEANALRHAPNRRVGLILASGADASNVEQTVACWRLQTWPNLALVLIGDPHDKALVSIARASGMPAMVVPVVDQEVLARLNIDWVVPAASGDLLHPSLAGIVSRQADRGSLAVAWDWFNARREGRSISLLARYRGPWRDSVAELSCDLRHRAFAVAARYWNGHPVQDAWRVRMGLPAIPASTHAEPLGIYAVQEKAVTPDPVMAAGLWSATFEHSPGGIRPASAATGVSVLILYRDKPQMTVKAIDSVLRQRFAGRLQLVLVDNQSTPETKALIQGRLEQVPPGIATVLLSYDEAFNHSRQCNLAAKAATEEVLLFLNNDVELLDENVVDQLGRWATLPGVATAGVCVVDQAGNAVGGGMRARRIPGAEFNSPVEEAAGLPACRPRSTVGNTFACAAISASTFEALGGLNEVDFPIGYNDVDFCLRAASEGWVHANLGNLRVTHAVGASRAKTDEIAQKLALRTLHAWLQVRALVEIEGEEFALPATILPELPLSLAEDLEQSS